jgi:hypothetical protein
VVDLGSKVRPPQCDAKQELHAGHDAIAIGDAHVRLGQGQLKTTHIIRCGVSGDRFRNAAKRLQLET